MKDQENDFLIEQLVDNALFDYKSNIKSLQQELISVLATAYKEAFIKKDKKNAQFNKEVALIGLKLDDLDKFKLSKILNLKTEHCDMTLSNFIHKNKKGVWQLEEDYLNTGVSAYIDGFMTALENGETVEIEEMEEPVIKIEKNIVEQAETELKNIILADKDLIYSKDNIKYFLQELILLLGTAYKQAFIKDDKKNAQFNKEVALFGLKLDDLDKHKLTKILNLKTDYCDMKLSNFIRRNKRGTWQLEKNFLDVDVSAHIDGFLTALDKVKEVEIVKIIEPKKRNKKSKAVQAELKLKNIIKQVEWLRKESMLDGEILIDTNIKKALQKVAKIQRFEAGEIG